MGIENTAAAIAGKIFYGPGIFFRELPYLADQFSPAPVKSGVFPIVPAIPELVPMKVHISPALVADLEAVAELFNQYRVFYEQASDLPAARAFIGERLQRQDAVLLWAKDTESGAALGFTQLYPSFSSVAMQRIYILNDLFVHPAGRRQGIAAQLLTAAEEHARQAGAIRLELATAPDNIGAQALYEREHWIRDPFFHYSKAT